MGYLLGVSLEILLSAIARSMLVSVLPRRVDGGLDAFRNMFDVRYNLERRREEEILPDVDDGFVDHDINGPQGDDYDDMDDDDKEERNDDDMDSSTSTPQRAGGAGDCIVMVSAPPPIAEL